MPLPRSQSAASSTPSSRQQRARSAHDVFIPAGRWQVDSICGVCSKPFSVVRGRHHCRHCGMSVCGKHSKNRAVVPSSLSSALQRVCDICFPQCQRGVTRKRRNTVGPRTISLRFDTESSMTTSTTTSQRTYTDSATSSTRSASAGRPKSASAPDRRRQPKPPLAARSANFAAMPEGENKIISIQDLVRMRKQQGQVVLQEPQSAAAFPASNQQILQYPSRMRRAYTSAAAPPQAPGASRMPTRQQESSRREPPPSANAENNSIPHRMRRANTSAATPGERQQQRTSGMRRHEAQTPPRDSTIEKIEKALAAIAANKQPQAPSKVLQSERRPLPFRRRAATAADAKARRSRVSFSSSDSEDSLSSLNDSSASERSSSDDDSNDEELIAKYLRRGVPLKSTSPTKPAELKRMDSSLAAIKEQQALSTSPELDGFDPTPMRKSLLRSSRSSYLKQPQNRKMSSISIGTISVTDSEGYEGEEEDDDDDDKSNSAMGASDVATVSDCNEEEEEEELSEPEAEAQPSAPRLSVQAVPPPPPPVYVGPVKSIAAQDPGSSSPPEVSEILVASGSEHTPANATHRAPPVEYQITSADLRLMRQIEELELEIQKCQGELPVLLEKLKQSERAVAQLQREVAESRARVQQYRKAHYVVNRSVRAAKTLLREHEYQAAVLELLRATSIDRSSAVAWFLLAKCRLRLGQLQDAEAACRTCVRLVQRTSASGGGGGAEVVLLGKILQDQGRHDEAIECYLSALQR